MTVSAGDLHGVIAFSAPCPVFYQYGMVRWLSTSVSTKMLFAVPTSLGPYHDADFSGKVDFGMDLEGVPHEFLSAWAWGGEGVPKWIVVRNLKRVLREGRYAAVVVSALNQVCELQFVAAALQLRIPLLLRTESSPIHIFGPSWLQPFRRAFIRFIARRATVILSIGSLCTEFYRQLGVPEERIFLTPYAVDNDYFFSEAAAWRAKREEGLDALGLSHSLPTLVFSGKLIPRKRPDEVLAIHKALLSAGIRTNVVIIGDGPMRGQLEREIKSSGLRTVRIVGFQAQKSIARYYALGDIFLFPSSFETWGLVVNEAMCFGMPVVTTKMVGSAVDLVKAQENGFVHEVGDVSGMAESVSRLVRDRDLASAYGRRSLQLVRGWSFDEDVAGIRKAMDYCLQSGNSRSRRR